MRALLRRTRVRLTATYSALFIVLATVVSSAFYVAYVRSQYASTDSELSERVQALINGLETDVTPARIDKKDAVPDIEQGEVSAMLLASDGTILDSIGRPVTPHLARAVYRRRPTFTTPILETMSDTGGEVRVLAKEVDFGNGVHGVMVGSHPMSEVQVALNEAKVLLVVVVVSMVVIASVLGYWTAGRALKPVRVIAGAARDISEHDLNRRIALDLPSDELGELAGTFNAMLARLESGFATLQRFTADAAHELRAPLAMIRAELEVSLGRARTADEYRATQRLVLSEVERMSRLADQLLLLARADAGSLAPRFERLDLSDLLEETVDRWRVLAGSRGVRLALDPPPPGSLWADRELLRRLIDNLLDNAVRHSPAGEDVTLTAAREDGCWRLEVADAGPGVDASIRDRLFQRFARADPARGRDTGGAGLGLALCAVIADLHGGSLALAPPNGPPPGAHFVVELAADPRQPVPPV
ncbi:MAG: two-component system, OmpR family, sensor kinase [Chloroflexota bacterium]|jgi:heavy metal sensor kinase|nr:two-component system, OmpR family, sensor kinase [Chloroflexota bacterium]